MKFSIGYNHDIKLLDLLDNYKDNIEALYFPIPPPYLGSGRYTLPKNSYINEIPELIKRCKSLDIKSQLLLNATCEGGSGLEKKFFFKVIDYIQKLKGLGLGSVIVTNPAYIREIKKQIKGVEIESSVNCYVKTVEHTLYLRDLGADILTIDRDINRNIALIKEIKNNARLKIRIMLNEGCLRNCPFRNMHYNYLSHGFSESDNLIEDIFPDKFCIRIYLKNPAKVFSVPFIPPDALVHYAGLTDYYKLSTRVFTTSRIESCLKAYIKGDFNGNLLEILDCPGLVYFSFISYGPLKKSNFFERMIKCNSNCNGCDYCNKLMEEAVIINSDFLKECGKKLEEDKKAVKLYEEILETSRDKFPIYLKLSKVYSNLRQHRKVVQTVNKAIALNPKNIDGRLLLGAYYEKVKSINNALLTYKEALEIFPSEGSIYFGLARIYYILRRYQEAIEAAKRTIELKYKSANSRFLLGSCYMKTRQYKKAIEELERAEKISPRESQINFSLSRCYRNISQIGQADKELKRGFVKLKKSKQIK